MDASVKKFVPAHCEPRFNLSHPVPWMSLHPLRRHRGRNIAMTIDSPIVSKEEIAVSRLM